MLGKGIYALQTYESYTWAQAHTHMDRKVVGLWSSPAMSASKRVYSILYAICPDRGQKCVGEIKPFTHIEETCKTTAKLIF